MDSRIALYVYDKSTVTIDPSSNVDFHQMASDYSADFVMTISNAVTLDLKPGVYGFVYHGVHGVSAPSTVTLVGDCYYTQKKGTWPVPPPPPPLPFQGRNDWVAHTGIFLMPMSATFG